jgi:ribose transport system permease protein
MTTLTSRRSLGLDRYSGLYIGAAFIVVFGIWKPDLFLTQATLHSVASSQAIVAMLGLAVLVPLTAGAYDLSVGAVSNFATILVVSLQTTHHWGMWPAIGVTLVCAAIIGAITGFIVVVFRVNSFIATLAAATILSALQSIVTNQAQPLPPTGTAWTELAQRQVFGFQIVFVYLIVIAVVLWWLLGLTPVGRYMYATGGNTEAARLTGVRTGRWVWVSLILSATLSGIAGILYASIAGPSLTYGPALLLPAFAAAFLGSTQFRPGRFNVWGTVLAVYVLAIGVKGLSFVTSVQWLNDMFNGVALVAAVAFAGWRQRAARVKVPSANEEAPSVPLAGMDDDGSPPGAPSSDPPSSDAPSSDAPPVPGRLRRDAASRAANINPTTARTVPADASGGI